MAKLTIMNQNASAEIPDGVHTLLSAGEKAGIDMEFGCRDGSCGTCCVEILQGMENLEKPSESELDTLDAWNKDPEKHRLACCVKILKGEVQINAGH